MSEFLTELNQINIDDRYSKLGAPLIFWSDKFKRRFEAPTGFVNDEESIPWLKGTSKRAGVIHDLVCRKEFNLTISECADLYFECMEAVDAEKYATDENSKVKKELSRFNRWWRRHVKSNVVRFNWAGFYHRWSVNSTYEEIKGNIA